MRSKHIPLLMSILVCITMISVGFSSWVSIHPPADDSAGGTLTSYPVYESMEFSEYVSSDGMTMFRYSSLSFLDASGAPQDFGLITVNYVIDVTKCAEKLGAEWNGSLTLDFALSYENITDPSVNLFESDPTYSRQVSVKATHGGSSVSVSPTSTANNTLTASLALSGLSSAEQYRVSVELRFDVPKNMTVDGAEIPANFRNAFGKYIKNFDDSKTRFLATASVKEVNG